MAKNPEVMRRVKASWKRKKQAKQDIKFIKETMKEALNIGHKGIMANDDINGLYKGR